MNGKLRWGIFGSAGVVLTVLGVVWALGRGVGALESDFQTHKAAPAHEGARARINRLERRTDVIERGMADIERTLGEIRQDTREIRNLMERGR